MKMKLPLIVAAAGIAIASTAAIANTQAPAGAINVPFWSGAVWDDDDYSLPRKAMPVPNVEVLKRAGMVRVKEVERDDGRIEVEGYDRNGHELEIDMDASGQRILRVRHDD